MAFLVLSPAVVADTQTRQDDDALEAVYVLKVRAHGDGQARTWFLKRAANTVVTGDPKGVEEVWRRDAADNISYESAFIRSGGPRLRGGGSACARPNA